MMGKITDLFPKKMDRMQCLFDEKRYSPREIAIKVGVSQQTMSRMKILAEAELRTVLDPFLEKNLLHQSMGMSIMVSFFERNVSFLTCDKMRINE